MKILSLIAGCCLMVGCASVPFEDWSKEDTLRQGAVLTLIAADWVQTTEIRSDSDYVETNPILGSHPSHARINLYMPVCMVAHTLVSGLLKPGTWREGWQYFWIGAEAYTVHHNYKIGVRP